MSASQAEHAGSIPVFRSIVGAKFALLHFSFCKRKISARFLAPPLRKKSRSRRLFACKRAHNGSGSLPTFCGQIARIFCWVIIHFKSVMNTRTIVVADSAEFATIFLQNYRSIAPSLLLSAKGHTALRLLVCKRTRNASARYQPFAVGLRGN